MPERVTLRVSVPSPAAIVSPVPKVPADAVITLSPAVPTMASTPVVSDQIRYYGILLLFSSLFNDTISIFMATYRIPTLTSKPLGRRRDDIYHNIIKNSYLP